MFNRPKSGAGKRAKSSISIFVSVRIGTVGILARKQSKPPMRPEVEFITICQRKFSAALSDLVREIRRRAQETAFWVVTQFEFRP
jgi:hypothetical protein